MKKSGHTDKTGGLPQNKTTRSIQDYSHATRRKSKANPGSRRKKSY